MKHSAITRLKCANGRLGRKHSPETRAKISAANRLRIQQHGLSRRYEIGPATLRVPTGTALAYLAGIVDGEGSIRFRAGRPFIAVYNTDTGLMSWLFEQTGRAGLITDKRGRVPCYTWTVSAANDVIAFCEAMLPHLIIKQADARRVLLFLRTKYGVV